MHNTSAILLSAGPSSRTSAQNKLFSPVIGAPLVRRVAGDYLAALDGHRGKLGVELQNLQRRVIESPERTGCMRFTRDHSEQLQAASFISLGYCTDIDMPEDFAWLPPTILERVS